MAGTPIDKIFNEPAIEAQVKRVAASIESVAKMMQELQNAANITKTASNLNSLTAASAALAAANSNVEKAVIKLKNEEEQLTVTMVKAAAANLQNSKGLSETERLVRLYDEGLKRLNGTLTTEAENLAQVRVANSEVAKQLKAQARDVLGLSGAYEKLQAQASAASLAAKNAGVQYGINSQQFKELSATALAMNNQLKAVDAGVGNFQRNVGNYASGFQNFTQVLREMPNFAISATVGVQSLSNNIPMLVAEMQAARAAGASWGGILLGLGRQLISFQAIAILAVTALTALPDILREMGKEAKEAEDKMRDFYEGIAKETTSLKTLFAVAKDVNQSMEVRRNAIKNLRDQYGNYLKDLSDEKLLAGDTAGKYDELSDAILRTARARAAADQITKLQAQKLMNEKKMLDEEAKGQQEIAAAPQKTTMASPGVGGRGTTVTAEQIAAGILNRVKITNDRLKKENDTLDKEMERLNKIVMDNQVKPFKEDKTEDKKEKEKQYFNDLYKLRISDLERQNIYLQEIRDNEDNSFDLRLQAAHKYALNEQEILNLNLADDKERNTFYLKNRKDSKDEEALIEAEYRKDQARAEVEYRKFLSAMHKKHLSDINEKTKQSEEDAQDERKKAFEEAENKIQSIVLKSQELENLALRDLAEKFLNGEIKEYEDYEKQKNQIALKYLKERISNEIAATEELLKLSGLDLKTREKYATQLSELKKKLAEAGVKFTENASNKETKSDEKRMKMLEAYLRDINRAVNTITSAINELATASFEQAQARLETERNGIEKNAALELERIQNSTLNEQQKADQIIILEAKKQAQIEENDRRRRKLDTERARFERLNSIAGIISGTALAVVNALGDKSTPGPLRIILAATIGALGAAQLVKAIATPVPKYAKGTKNHPGGPAIVGDGGKSERVILPGGETFDTPDKPTLVNLPKGTKVLPDADAINKAMMAGMIRKQAEKETRDKVADAVNMQTEILKRALDKNKTKVNTRVNVNLGRDFWLYKNVYE